ncbi:MAG: hypothetical protein RL291_1637 [Pseudomonadota bacterium]
MNWTLETAPLFSWPVFWTAAIVALALVIALLMRRQRGAALRALALGTLLLAIANPTLREETRDSLSNIAVVLLDESTSQQIGDRPQQAATIRQQLEARFRDIPNLEVRFVAASRPTGEPGSGTNLFADLNRALANTPVDRLAGVIMVTDGQVHDVPKSAAALGFDAPVHAILTGRPDEFDRRIDVLKAPKFGIVGQSRDIEVKVVETGRSQGASNRVTVRVRRDGQPDEIRRTVIGQLLTLTMPFPHAGQNILELELEPVQGELTTANNRVVIAAEGVRENLRVLLVSGEPHAGERTWRNLLKSDAAVDLVHFTILRPPSKVRESNVQSHELSLIQFPTRELFSEKIKDFDLIIFDRYQNRDNILNFFYYENIARYVEGGGALLAAVGDDFAGQQSIARTLLANVLPASPTGQVIERAFKAKLSTDGVKHPVTRALPGVDLNDPAKEPTWGRWFRQVDVNVNRGRTIMNGANDRPLLTIDRRGKGRVALLASDHVWLWARGYEGGGPHTDMLRRLAHWLMKEPDLEEERLFATTKGLKLTIERRTMEERVNEVTVEAPGGNKRTVTLSPSGPGAFSTTIDVPLPGLYKMQTQASFGPLTAVAHAGSEDAREMSEVTATPDKLKPLTDQTGGGVFWAQGGGGLLSAATGSIEVPRLSLLSASTRVLAGSGWMGLKDREAFVTKGVKVTPMFTGLMALAALLALISLAWWREGR